MPIIQVSLVEGRCSETKEQLIDGLTDAACKALGVEESFVHVVLYELSEENCGKKRTVHMDPS